MNGRIVLVEDHDSVRRSLDRALTLSGFAVRSFECAEELLEFPNDEVEADCFVIDLHLPGISGVDLCRRLRERGVQVPVICISSDHSDLLRTSALASGAFACLLKPFEIGSLLDLLDRVRLRSRLA